MSDTQIIILAGGQGKRMGGDMPKVLILLKNRPLIEHLLDSVMPVARIKPVVVVGFKGELVKQILGDKVIYATQTEQLGTGHAVMCAREKIPGMAKNIAVLYGDMPAISSDTIKNLLDLHVREDADLTMMTINVPHFNNEYAGFNGFGRVVRGADGKIIKITEVKDANDDEKKITELNPSLFCFKSDWLWGAIAQLKNNNVQKEYYLTDLVGLAISQNKKIASLAIDPLECIGVNTPEELRIAGEIIPGE